MGRIQLPTLEIDVESPDHELRIDGIVVDMRDHTIEIFQELGCPEDALESVADYFGDHKAGGRTMKFDFPGGITKWFVFYSAVSDRSADIYLRGHEETHVLHGIGQIPLLQKPLRSHGLDIDLMQYADPEVCTEFDKEFVASLGGLYVLKRNELGVDRVLSRRDSLADTEFAALNQAIALYANASLTKAQNTS